MNNMSPHTSQDLSLLRKNKVSTTSMLLNLNKPKVENSFWLDWKLFKHKLSKYLIKCGSNFKPRKAKVQKIILEI